MSRKRLIVISGPTASGKSALAVEKALHLDTEIISADSRQIYRHIPILTAVPSMEERQGVKHYLLEELELGEYFSASLFEQSALTLLEDIFMRRDDAIVCGGSMMYVDALCNGIDDIPTVPDHIRQETVEEWQQRGTDWLLAELQRLDPQYYDIVDRHNTKRVLHAVEIIRAAGVTYTSLRTGKRKERPFEIEKILLMPEREILFDRINRRVDIMMEMGALEEARKVYPLRHLNSLNTVGFKELFAYFDGTMTLDEAISRLKKNTRVYAKKQMLWCRKQQQN
jgi:tRNA dimethylallyltransferase